MTINFVAFENTTFSFTIDANNDDDFEGFHSFVISLPTDSDFIVPLNSDTANTTVTISDFDGEIPDCSMQCSNHTFEALHMHYYNSTFLRCHYCGGKFFKNGFGGYQSD